MPCSTPESEDAAEAWFNNFDFCPIPPNIDNGYLMEGHRDVGDYAVYACRTGFQFPEGTSYRSTVCERGGTWSITVPDCEGKHVASDISTDREGNILLP